MNLGTDGKQKKKCVGKMRKTQLITTNAPGSIADMADYSVIMAATDYWSALSPIIYEPNLQRLLGMDHFCAPYATESESPKGNPDIPAFRFPRMHFCPECGDLKDFELFKNIKDKNNLTCQKCNKPLVPSRFLVACENGHLEDFPYRWWVHYGKPEECKEPERYDQLSISFDSSSGGLSSIKIKCKACGKERSMEGCMGKDALRGYKCFGKRPWIGMGREFNDPQECHAPMRTIQRGASNVFFSITQSALTIPPWSDALLSDLMKYKDNIKMMFDNKSSTENIRCVLQALFFAQLSRGQYTLDDYFSEAKKLWGESDQDQSKDYTEKELFEDEYKALCEGREEKEDDAEPAQFIAEEGEVPETLSDYIDSIMLVKRLREVMAVKGFRRLSPDKPKPEDDLAEGAWDSDFTPLWKQPRNWLPAVELRGEGIFIRLNESAVSKWESANNMRYDEMKTRLGEDHITGGKYSSRYVLLHTLAHLLIRQLSLDCGYSEAALKERIYSTYPSHQKAMAGILIYTSSSDSDGSLGGLVRQGEKEIFETVFLNMLQEASWCSSDPLCSDSKAQGYNSLNYAACHACTLLPETSCEARNCLLDRIAVVGKIENRKLGFFGRMLEK